MRCNFHQSVGDCDVGEYGGKPVGVATVGEIGRHEARMCWVMGQVACSDVNTQANNSVARKVLTTIVVLNK